MSDIDTEATEPDPDQTAIDVPDGEQYPDPAETTEESEEAGDGSEDAGD